MDSTVLRPSLYSLGSASYAQSKLEQLSKFSTRSGGWPNFSDSFASGLKVSRKLNYYSTQRNLTLISCTKTSEAGATAKADDDSASQGSRDENTLQYLMFPNEVEALALDLCDETEIAELKLKVGDFEMHLKRNVGAKHEPFPDISPKTAPPIPGKPMNDSGPVAQSPPQVKSSPFKNTSFGQPSKLASLEASASSNYVLISSPTVGFFRRNRTVKGKKQPPLCEEGNIIKEGQVVGYLDQFGTQLPVKSEVDGEIIKLLFDDGDAVGYGDPIVAVLPSFHDIK